VTRRTPLHADWFDSGVAPRDAALWRGVEAQHLVATMKLVDTAPEQHLLEDLLEASKPALPAQSAGRHYLIATPFRYRPQHESRFRPAGSPGLWYGAEALEVACAEVAYWKWRFLRDSDALRHQALHTQHTFFEARISGACVDLTAPPWVASARAWTHPTRYADCQALAQAARERDVAWIRYSSARSKPGVCGVALTAQALALEPGFAQQTWNCKTTLANVYLRHAQQSFSFDAARWA
jgi:hypothetical protein